MTEENISKLSAIIVEGLTPLIRGMGERAELSAIRQINQPINPADRPVTHAQMQRFINRGGVHFNGDEDESFL